MMNMPRIEKKIKQFSEEEFIEKLDLEKSSYILSIALETRYLAGDSESRSITVEYLVPKDNESS